jgi:hypothetical protein
LNPLINCNIHRYTIGTGIYNENTYTGQGFIGNCIGGVSFYTGAVANSGYNAYPSSYTNSVWILDFGQRWIRTLSSTADDKYIAVKDFENLGTSVLTLERDPNTGNIW